MLANMLSASPRACWRIAVGNERLLEALMTVFRMCTSGPTVESMRVDLALNIVRLVEVLCGVQQPESASSWTKYASASAFAWRVARS